MKKIIFFSIENIKNTESAQLCQFQATKVLASKSLLSNFPADPANVFVNPCVVSRQANPTSERN